MTGGCISTDRILAKLDEHLNKNDYGSAERHLTYWLSEAARGGDGRAELLIRNELMGLYRKLGREDEALGAAEAALDTVQKLGVSRQVGAATTYLNAATVYKAFGKAKDAIPLFERASEIYERELDVTDTRRAGLFNNMALALVDLGLFDEADELYGKALLVLENDIYSSPERAVTYLNMASAAEARWGLVLAEEKIGEYLSAAETLLESYPEEYRDGNYAFVCEKCASVFGYYGYFVYERELYSRARRIYGNEGN